MAQAIFCTLKSSVEATIVVDRLKAAGFAANDISVLMPDDQGSKDFAVDNQTKSPEGASIGVGTGAIVGGGLGWLAGIGALAIPGVGPLIVAGPIMAALTGAAPGGTWGVSQARLSDKGFPSMRQKNRR